MQIKDEMREFGDDGKQELVFTIVASPEEVDEASKAFFAEVAQRDLKGFRKGKAPRAVLEQAVGGHANAMGGIAEQLINNLAFKAIDDADIIFIEDPSFNVESALVEGEPFSFTISGAVAPEMKLTSYDPVAIEMPPQEATQKEIDFQLRELQDFYHSFEDITDPDHKAELGDYVNCTMTVTDSEGKVISGLKTASRLIGLGEGTMPESFDENMVGAKVEDILEFDFDAKKPDGTSDFGDGNLHAVVQINGFRKCILPELDDELAYKVGCTDAEDMRKQMERNINIQKERELPKIKESRVIDEVIKRLDGDVPEYYVDFIRQDVGREFMQNLEKSGTNLQEWMLNNSINGDEMKDDIAKESLRRAQIDCALEALFAEKGMALTEDDINEVFAGEDDPIDTRKAWEDAHRMADIRKMCRQTKATRWLVDNADVTIEDDTVIIEVD